MHLADHTSGLTSNKAQRPQLRKKDTLEVNMSRNLIKACRRSSSWIVGHARRLLSYIERRLYVAPQAVRVHQWWAADPQEQQRYEYDLTSDSLVFDLGGYRGDWASDMFARHMCCVEVFEPVPHYAQDIETRFANNPKIKVHALGLAGQSGEASIAISDDRSSLYVANEDAEGRRGTSRA